ncbi:uncharacterized protein LAESUDRAFT_648895 [Laetiporus sulphureus 93-53]|uniref:HTH La-type RNA-binding domain-containing protein n=1 Tax=Laetiporus sulphureus 93-53 TaxID=1314785 RepID=A0A165F4N9_9APHY|nr:uncharacterized protein LAESUDRAFT_648895 [Laetiporus sulphureus 93-53]KZT08382.1 hypothetical protein LAESUDRAFT_648895 [Laetiporus sulphureus 93-53]
MESAILTAVAVDSATHGIQNLRIDDEDQNERALNAMRQVEFYFSDSNLPYDRWAEHSIYFANAEHWVPIATIATFKRLSKYQPLGPQWLVDTLRQSIHLEVDGEGTHIRRRTEVQQNSAWDRSVYAKGFGIEVDGLQRDLERFFECYGRTNAVRMRQDRETNAFKGSVFTEFADPLSVQLFLKADPKPSWNGQELLIMTKRNHEIAQKKLERSRNASETQEQTGTTKGKDVNKEKSKTQGDEQNSAGQDSDKNQSKPQLQFKFMGKETTIHEGEQGFFLQEEEMPHVSGASLKFECDQDDISLSDIQKIMRMLYTSGHRPFVKYHNGESAGLIGFKKPLSREDIVCIPAYLKTCSGQYLTWSSPDDETERTFQMECAQLHALRVLRALLRYRGKRDSLQIKGIAGNATDKMDTDSDVVNQDPVLAVPAPFSASDGRAEKRKRDLEDDDTDEDDIYDANLLTEARLVVRIAKRARM